MSVGRLRARRIGPDDRTAARALLLAAPAENLALLDQVDRFAKAAGPGEPPAQIHGAFDGDRLVALASLRPSVALSHGIAAPAIDALLPALRRVPIGLLKSERRAVDLVWPALAAAGRESIIDRIEVARRIARAALGEADLGWPGRARVAHASDLPALVHAARASLWEENRPDPAERDPEGFRRWVEGRIARARVVCEGERVVFVAYADVMSHHGWLVQGVYTWPDARRRGFARQGMHALLREAFAAGASHVQLAVVAGNDRATRLYEKLGFGPFAELRTILFH